MNVDQFLLKGKWRNAQTHSEKEDQRLENAQRRGLRRTAYSVGESICVGEFYGWYDPDTSEVVGPFRPVKDRREAVSFYREWIRDKHDLIESAKKVLRGKDLVCWCPLDQPCHADILLELANK